MLGGGGVCSLFLIHLLTISLCDDLLFLVGKGQPFILFFLAQAIIKKIKSDWKSRPVAETDSLQLRSSFPTAAIRGPRFDPTAFVKAKERKQKEIEQKKCVGFPALFLQSRKQITGPPLA